MKKKREIKMHGFQIGIIAGAISFVALSVFVGGIVEFSRGDQLGKWLWDSVSYAVMYKLTYKLAASLFVGFVTSFVCNMIEYGKQIDAKRRSRPTRIDFESQEEPYSGEVGKIA